MDQREEPLAEIRLVDASPGDEEWLDGLRRRAYAELFRVTWGGWDEDRHARQFSECMERGRISIIEAGGTRVGMIQLLEHDDAIELAEVQVEPSRQGRGIGTHVIRELLSDARARGLGVRLSVGLKNHEAIRLYERLGFESAGRSATHCHMTHAAEV